MRLVLSQLAIAPIKAAVLRQALFSEAGDRLSIARSLATGAAVWAAYSTVQLFVNGIVLDELVLAAQVISGAFGYPPGHPHPQFYSQAFSLVNYAAAAFWLLIEDPFILSAVRNVFFLFVSVFTPFALTLVLTRRAIWGYVAGALTASDTILPFHGHYPMFVFPEFNTHGHFGVHAALLVVVFLMARMWRVGGLFLGLLPVIHAAMPLVIWPWSACHYLLMRKGLARRHRVRLRAAVLLGIAVCGVFGAFLFTRASPVEAIFPYDSKLDGELVYQEFIRRETHRQPLELRSYAYLLNPIALFTIGGLLWWDTRRRAAQGDQLLRAKQCLSLLLFGLIIWLYVYGAWLLQLATGWLPLFVQISMPNRLSNLSAMLLVPISVASLALALERMTEKARLLTLALLAALLCVSGIYLAIQPDDVADHLILAVWGVLFATHLFAGRSERKRRLATLLTVAVIGGLLLSYLATRRLGGYSFAAAFLVSCTLLGLISKVEWKGLSFPKWSSLCGVALLCGTVITACGALPGRKVWFWDRKSARFDMVSENDKKIIRWLNTHTGPDEFILPFLWPRTEFQVKAGRPVLMEGTTIYMMTYMPHLSGTVGVMMKDLYGLDFTNSEQVERFSKNGQLWMNSPAWIERWRSRSRDEWQTVGREYGFRVVITPPPLDFPEALAVPGGWNIYTIPTLEPHSLAESGESLEGSIISKNGKAIRIVPGAMDGAGDAVSQQEDHIRISGWASDGSHRRSADQVLVFVNGEAIDYGHSVVRRPDLVEGFNRPSLLEARSRSVGSGRAHESPMALAILFFDTSVSTPSAPSDRTLCARRVGTSARDHTTTTFSSPEGEGFPPSPEETLRSFWNRT